MNTFEMENPMADPAETALSRFSGSTSADQKIADDFVSENIAPLHAARDKTITPSVMLSELSE